MIWKMGGLEFGVWRERGWGGCFDGCFDGRFDVPSCLGRALTPGMHREDWGFGWGDFGLGGLF